MNINFYPFPDLKADGLFLRQIRYEDQNEIFILKSDEEVLKYLDAPKAESLEEARSFIKKINDGINQNHWIFWAVTTGNSDKLAGTICLWNICRSERKAELGYELLPDCQGKGIMSCAVAAVIKYAFENLKLQTIEAVVNAENERSIRLLERSGFVGKGSFREKKRLQSGFSNMLVYERTNAFSQS